jgi:hypothetical protein
MTLELNLPHDVDALRALVVTSHQTIARLEHNIRILTQLAFGKKNERRVPVEGETLQASLFFQELAAAAAFRTTCRWCAP